MRGSRSGGLDRTLGLVFGLVRGAALVILAYIGMGMVVQVDRWPDVVLKAESMWPVYQGARWVVEQLAGRISGRGSIRRRLAMRQRRRR